MSFIGKPVQFVPLSSEIELPFYSAFFSLKLDHDKLDSSARQILGSYAPRVAPPEESCKLQILGSALTSHHECLRNGARAEGVLRNTNTWEEFRNLNRADILRTAGRQIWDAIQDGTIYSVPSLLSSFVLISFADLKRFTFTYWFAFPALHSSWIHTAEPISLTPTESTRLVERVNTFTYSHRDGRDAGFFLAKKVPLNAKNPVNGHSHVDDSSDEEYDDSDAEDSQPSSSAQSLPFKWEVDSLRSFEHGFFQDVSEKDRYIVFLDSSTYPQNPGWQLRNLLVLVQQRFRLNKVRVLCLRDTHANRDAARSIVLSLEATTPPATEMPKATGWEKDGNVFRYKRIDLAAYMDPKRIADQSVDLNLKLMKWRLAPNLNLNIIKSRRCLLLGAGTLGAYVARNLLGWGVRHITFVDNGNVSYSNPVRQPLYTFKDCAEGPVKKALRAAEALREIYPNVVSEGHDLTVPMLGHPIAGDGSAVEQAFAKLRELIESHDVIFLLMDTRESRWLPTVIGKALNKVVLNAALGFDGFVVMRHGLEPEYCQAEDTIRRTLGCYFCNDVVAPADSMKDQTLDQQCTVTRPGAAPIASALLVELFASLLQHPLSARAPASQPTHGDAPSREPIDHPLGLIPHQIRGSVATFQQLVLRGESYPNCSACSPSIVDAYRRDGWAFVERALREREYIAELSGLAEVQRQAEKMSRDIEWDEEEEGSGEEGEKLI